MLYVSIAMSESSGCSDPQIHAPCDLMSFRLPGDRRYDLTLDCTFPRGNNILFVVGDGQRQKATLFVRNEEQSVVEHESV